LYQWWVWNQIPVTVGNVVSGVLLTGLALYFTFRPKEQPALNLPVEVPQQGESNLEQATTAG
jgi:hypothetical protein